jgi:hypothetical protein
VTASVLGLDLSLRRTAAVCIPANWDHEWSRVWWHVPDSGETPHNPREAIVRMLKIASAVCFFAQTQEAEHIFVEGHAFSMGGGAYALERAELVGVVKAALFGDGHTVTPIVASSARKLLFGKLPAKGAKVAAFTRLRAMGCPFAWKDDEADAFVIANAGRHALGLPCLAAEQP